MTVEQQSNHITGVIEESSATDAVDRIRSTYTNQIVGLQLYEEVDLTEIENKEKS